MMNELQWRTRSLLLVAMLFVLSISAVATAFTLRPNTAAPLCTRYTATTQERQQQQRRRSMVSKQLDVMDPAANWMNDDDDDLDIDIKFDFVDEDEEEFQDDEDEEGEEVARAERVKTSRWDSLNPKIKERLIKAGQERAIANKKKREPQQAKKRRMMMFVKEKQRERKIASRVKRPLPLTDRTPLSAIIPGMELTGVVISLTQFGAYVDVGTECDGLLHISQLSRDVFVEHPRQLLTPGEEVVVRVRRADPEKKKLQLTMLPPEMLEEEEEIQDEKEERIQLDEIMVDDELWGEIKRVTDYGAYVDVGAIVPGFLHFMDHPAFGWPENRGKGAHPSEYMSVSDRVRIWVADVDIDRKRIKLTANRPAHLPGPRRELLF